REAEVAVTVQPRQVQVGRRHGLALVDLGRHAGPALVHEIPDEQPQQREDGSDRDCPERPHQTTNTVVPMSTWSNSHSESGTCMRTQPCDALYPIDEGLSVPWMPTPGASRPIQRVPSGLSGPGGTGFRPFAQSSCTGGYHHGFLYLTTMRHSPRGVG